MKNAGRKIVATTGEVLYVVAMGTVVIAAFSFPHLKHVAHQSMHHLEDVLKRLEKWKKEKD